MGVCVLERLVFYGKKKKTMGVWGSDLLFSSKNVAYPYVLKSPARALTCFKSQARTLTCLKSPARALTCLKSQTHALTYLKN